MGRRNTKPKSTYRSLNSYESFASVDSSGTPSWLGSDWLQSDKALLHGEVLSDQLTRWCCIDRLSWHGLSDKWIRDSDLRAGSYRAAGLRLLGWAGRRLKSDALQHPRVQNWNPVSCFAL